MEPDDLVMICLQGAPVAERRTFRQWRILVGSGPESDFVVDDPTVAAVHCRIEWGERELRLVDLGSPGTFLHGIRVYETALPAVARVSLGRSVIEVRRRALVAGRDPFDQIVARSPSMRRLTRLLRRVAASRGSVVLEGERGTGKRLLATVLHEASDRATRPFVVLDAAPLAGKNATPLIRAVDAARGGTLFVRHIDALPLEVQPLLLGVVESRMLRYGEGTGARPIDLRLIASATRPLTEAVAGGRLRRDLFYCINVVRVRVLPLRERPEDVRALIEHLVHCRSPPGAELDLSAIDWDSAAGAPWPGNVAELETLVESAVSHQDSRLLTR
jgi:DNA-binding NtrC family response regulator